MLLDDFKKQMTLLESKHKKEIGLLRKEYALSNNKVQVGDKITTKAGTITIEVESIGVYLNHENVPECLYRGKNLTKAGTQNKREPHETIYQSQLNS